MTTGKLDRRSWLIGCSAVLGSENWDNAVQSIAKVRSTALQHPDLFVDVENFSQLLATQRSPKMGIILNVQGSLLFERQLDRVAQLHALGVRVFQLTYNRGDLVGDGCLEPRDAGLTNWGRDVIGKLDELRAAIDISHSGGRTGKDALRAAKRPVLITHTGCAAIFPHPRNKDDATLRLTADKGGVVGIYFMPFIGRPTDDGAATVEMVLDHVDHAIKVCGADHVGIGTDGVITPTPDTEKVRQLHKAAYESRQKLGISAPEEHRPWYVRGLNTANRLEVLALAMAKRGHSARTIEKFLGQNFCRALGDIWVR